MVLASPSNFGKSFNIVCVKQVQSENIKHISVKDLINRAATIQQERIMIYCDTYNMYHNKHCDILQTSLIVNNIYMYNLLLLNNKTKQKVIELRFT